MTNLYRHFNKADRLLYVGVSLSAITRLSQHKTCSKWFDEISKVSIEKFPNREAALKAEREAIVKEKPLHNIIHKQKASEKPTQKKQSSDRLIARVVEYRPMYTTDQAGDVLGVSGQVVKALINNGKIGWVQVGSRVYRGIDLPIIRITGWQLIEYIESLSNLKGKTIKSQSKEVNQ